MDFVRLGGFRTAAVTREALAEQMLVDVRKVRAEHETPPRLIFSSNGQGIALAGRSQDFQDAMNRADIIHADGMPVVLFSRFTKRPLPERIATTDFFHDAARVAEREGISFFMLGDSEQQNRAACEAISRRYPKLRIAGRHHGYFQDEDEDRICAEVVKSGADVLWVALGKPKQEFWSVRNKDKLSGVAWVKTCGGLYSFLAGTAPRAPVWMQRAGLEWVHRTMKEPRRLLVRYLATNPVAMLRLISRSEYR